MFYKEVCEIEMRNLIKCYQKQSDGVWQMVVYYQHSPEHQTLTIFYSSRLWLGFDFSLITWFYSTPLFKIISELQPNWTPVAVFATWVTPAALQSFAHCGLCQLFNYHFYCTTPNKHTHNSIIVTAFFTGSPGMKSVKQTQAWIKHYCCTQS